MNRIQTWIGQIKTIEDVGTTFGIGGILLVGIGGFLNLNFLVNLGFASFGAGVVAWGVNAMQRGEMPSAARGLHLVEWVESILARAWGLVLVLGGLLLLGYGVLSLLNPRSPVPLTIRQFFSSPQGSGVLLLGGSLVGLLFALTMMFVSDVRAGNALVRFVLSLPGRFIGLVLFIFCSALAAVALVQIFAPAAWEAWFQAIVRQIGFP